ncbi:MAG TPA: hypothetical protein VKU60_02755 [Chloroflexota bacterium]|nr:hypothetical protein [Chloroflexota bacterium]
MIDVRNAAYQYPDSWFVGRTPEVRPRDSVRRTIKMAIDVAWPPSRPEPCLAPGFSIAGVCPDGSSR